MPMRVLRALRPLALALVLLVLAVAAGHDDGPSKDAPRPPHDIADDLPFAVTTSTAATAPRFDSCAAVWDAGAAPIRRGDPGYGSHLDRDGDGIACEHDPR